MIFIFQTHSQFFSKSPHFHASDSMHARRQDFLKLHAHIQRVSRTYLDHYVETVQTVASLPVPRPQAATATQAATPLSARRYGVYVLDRRLPDVHTPYVYSSLSFAVIHHSLTTRTLRGKVTLLKGEGDVVWLHPLVGLGASIPLVPSV
jgi:hypothetical protein